nr:antitoxin Xre/MbcA/ParS toxin-binding domain-containing protein [uncultured Holophaga sp.]
MNTLVAVTPGTALPGDAALLLSAFRSVAAVLRLTLPEQAALLGVSRATVAGWKSLPGQDPDKLDRMALVVDIYGLASEAFPGERGGEGWLRRPNTAPLFAGEAPLDCMLAGRFETLFRIHDHLLALARVW